ncbi:MAG: NAD(+) synthase, partial [Acidobacteria bacterium]|nr:NAD(+) synthase [Acidobacteriota bacterium]
CLIADGEILGFVAKQNLAADGLHYEPRWFKAWPVGERAILEMGDERYPLGDLWFEVGGIRLGFEICEDAWVAERPGTRLSRRGVDVILNPSASHFAFDKIETRKRFVIEGSRAFGATYVYANLLGNEAGRTIYDGGALIASAGTLITEGSRFSFADWGVATAVIDLELPRQMQAKVGSFRPLIEKEDGQLVRASFEPIELDPPAPGTSKTPEWERGPRRKEEEFSRSVSLALFDYMRKSRSRGFVISLSGGADSSACAALVRTMAELAWAELGREGVESKLRWLGWKDFPDSPTALTGRLLLCAYQATRNSSEATRNSAETVARGVGAKYLELDVDALVDGYVGMIEKGIGRDLTWETDDITLQNIQARVRAPSIWMLANIRNALLLATSNRSEAAVGYATMDGDTAGGLSPIGGIDKAFLREWLRWAETDGPDGIEAIPELSAVNRLEPTAELRPLEQDQTDEKDLMPYPVLDAIERAAIRDRRSPLEVYRLMRPRFPEYGADVMKLWVTRFFTLWARNQWKRERYAPSFHVDDRNLDPKTWYRFPILSGGYRLELERMERWIAEEGEER